jgi:hypothetical protein
LFIDSLAQGALRAARDHEVGFNRDGSRRAVFEVNRTAIGAVRLRGRPSIVS